MIQAYFISDLHLKNERESNSERLLLFLHSIESGERPATHLFLVGDIFDLWIHDHRYFVDKFKRIVNAIRTVVLKGIEVHYFEGNHDLYLTSFWQQDVGVRVHDGPRFFHLGEKKIRVEHGDFMNPDDRGYLFLRRFLRTTFMQWIAEHLPGSLVQRLGAWASDTSGQYTRQRSASDDQNIRYFMHNYAESVVKEQSFDYLITGHTHLRDEFTFTYQDRQVVSLNLGSWLESVPQILKIDENGHKFIVL